MVRAYLDHPGPLALAHRGFSLDGLENSMVAFSAAVDLGYRYVETDVHATRDGVAVAFHDASLDRVTDAAGLVADLPWSTVGAARIGGSEPVPTLADLLGSWPALRVNIDVKSAAAVGPTVEVIERAAAHDRVCVTSFSDARRRAVVRALSRPVATSAGTRTVAGFLGATAVHSARARSRALREVDCLQVPERQGRIPVVTAATVAAAHASGVQVHVWTVNEPAEMARLLDLGVDGLVTDRADLLRDVLRTRGQWVG
ncbi:glycerophosphodiester phosphodiesterase family protein [Actinotalea sp.]|uniref:glycerophosphodiester phosphodiesterase family protein n=1 Tax=Actinotalea sp. TaxID=1872145 RepID=UPI002BFA1870|nr:glycerophosphodiester phosphodiesterase family protein [Actinotalea sp.]HQY34770.1 glycerophosphodiester phosphodiesterase family protein [Actinotalea sp.]HRA50482.1 glycerophosphodiester phosphodiesterase family protein [Actinotalea sp.]